MPETPWPAMRAIGGFASDGVADHRGGRRMAIGAAPRVAVLGIETVGAAVAERLLEAGFTVDVWDRTTRPVEDLARQGAIPHGTPAEAVAGATVVVTMLPTAAAVREVMLRQGTVDALPLHGIWLQMGAIGLDATDSLVATVAVRRPDLTFVDAQVTGDMMGWPVLWLDPGDAAGGAGLAIDTWLAFAARSSADV